MYAIRSYYEELIYGLRISAVMTSKVFAVSRNCTMRDVRTIMKNNSISGVPSYNFV